MKQGKRGRKKGSVSFRRIKLIDLINHYNVKALEPISDTTTVIVSNVWAEMVSIPGVSVVANEEIKKEEAKKTKILIKLSDPLSS